MIERRMLHEVIVSEIKKFIEEKNLKAGDKLPSQEELVKMLGVSRTSLREALRTLQAIDVIEVKNGKGIFIKQKEEYVLEAKVNMKDEKNSLLNVLELRRAIEGLAVRLAAERATDEEIMKMERNLKIMTEKAKRGECHPTEDKEFHYTICRASKNPVLIDILEDLYCIFDVMWQNPFGIGKALNEGIDQHIELFNSIRNKKPRNAEKVFMKLMDEVELIIKAI